MTTNVVKEAYDEFEELLTAMHDGELHQSEQARFDKLENFIAELESIFSNPLRDSDLIHENDFEDHARQLADDIGVFHVPSDQYGEDIMDISNRWPFTCIDWEYAANELKHDYTCVEFDGVTYYCRD